jgi:preprotein translocase subunit SecA
LLGKLRSDVTKNLVHLQILPEAPPPEIEPRAPTMHETHADPTTGTNEMDGKREAPQRTFARPKVALNPKDPVTWGKVPRNSACPCGSGKKYKHCHGSPNYAPTATA